MALADDKGSPTRKGDKRAYWEIEAVREGKRKRAERLKREAWERVGPRIEADAAAKRRVTFKKYHPEFGARALDRMIRGMTPGQWYGRFDMAVLAGVTREHGNGQIGVGLLKRGLIERCRNPAWGKGRKPSPSDRAVGEPMYLYRLTSAGEAHRDALQLLG